MVARACLECNTPEVYRERARDYRKRNPDKVKEQNDRRTKEYIREKSKEYYKRHSEKIKPIARIKVREYYRNNREKCIACATESRKRNIDKVKIRQRAWQKRSFKENPERKIAANLRRRLHRALSGKRRAGSAVRDLGCSVGELMKWLEGKFVEGMSWDNYGPIWHVDHINPLSSFDLTDTEQFKLASHYTNLQPLFASDNIKKGGVRSSKKNTDNGG